MYPSQIISHANNQRRISVMLLRYNCRKYKRAIPFKRVETRILSYIRSILNSILDVHKEHTNGRWMWPIETPEEKQNEKMILDKR